MKQKDKKQHDSRMQIRMPKDLKEAIEKKAAELGVNFSEFIRESCRERLDKLKDKD